MKFLISHDGKSAINMDSICCLSIKKSGTFHELLAIWPDDSMITLFRHEEEAATMQAFISTVRHLNGEMAGKKEE